MTHRVGYFSSCALAAVGLVYIGVAGTGIAVAGSDPIRDPILAVMEVLTFLAALLVVLVMAAVHDRAVPDTRIFGSIALSFAVVMTGLTSAVHFVALSAGRQTGLTTLGWPSALYAVELLAWDLFLGLSLVSAAFVFRGPGLARAVRWSLAATGGLCLLGTAGPLMGDMAFQRVGIVGYGVGLPITSVLIALTFRKQDRTA